MLTKKSNIFVTVHKGLMGSDVIRRLINHGYKNINTITRNKLDLRDQREVFKFFQKNKSARCWNGPRTSSKRYET